MAKILIIDDELSVREALKHLLQSEGHVVVDTNNPQQGIEMARADPYDVVVTDLQMPEMDGLHVIQVLHREQPQLPIILVTGHHTTEAAIEATRRGAYDYILQPVDPPQFLDMIEKAVAQRQVSHPVCMDDQEIGRDSIIGKSQVMRKIYSQIGKVAATTVPVLIRGEVGTGKELIARAIHHHSERATQPFIVVDCAVPENVLEGELFGLGTAGFGENSAHKVGRLEQANHATLLLDEIGGLTLSTQARLVRFLQEKSIRRDGGNEILPLDVRVIASTNKDLDLAMRQNRFRSDLFFLLGSAVIDLPALHERQEDIPELTRYLLLKHAREFGSPNPTITNDAIKHLEEQPWPGNVRELENVLRKAVLLSRGFTLTKELVLQAMLQVALPRSAENQPVADFAAELLTRAESGDLNDVHSIYS